MRKLFICGLVFANFLAACGSAGQPGSLESRQIADLETRLAALEAQLSAMPTAASGAARPEDTDGDVFGVVVAQHVIDTAGFHSLDEELNEAMTVDPAYLSTVNRVRKVAAQAPWPEALHDQAGAFVDLLAEFATALDADDAEAAAALATEAHTAQHDLSHAIDNWLGDGHGEGDHGG